MIATNAMVFENYLSKKLIYIERDNKQIFKLKIYQLNFTPKNKSLLHSLDFPPYSDNKLHS